MSFAFPGGHGPRTPDTVLYRDANGTPLRTPDAALYRAADSGPLHPRAPLLVAPRSNDPNHLALFRRPSFSSITQPMVHSPSAHRSRTVSSANRVEHQTISAAPASIVLPRVGGSGTAPSRSRTVSSGPSMRLPGPYINLAPSLPPTTGRENDPALANGSHRAKSRYTTGNKTLHHQLLHPMMRDIALINAVTVAGRGSTEFRWYPVWVIVIKDWIFPNSNTSTVACNLAPQYVLEYTPKPGVPSPGSTPGSVAKPKKTWVIPDFAQVLQYVQTSSNGSRIRHVERVILLVENKPKMTKQEALSRKSPFHEHRTQIHKQAAYAFLADPSLRMIGVILAIGTRWRYVEVYRPLLDSVLLTWIDTDDKTYRQRKGRVVEAVPHELEDLSNMDDQSFELLDNEGRSAQALEIIARRIKGREKEMWNL